MRILRRIVVLIMVVGAIGTATLVATPQKAKAAVYDPIILVHGFNPSASQDCNTGSEFGTIKSYFRNALPTNLVYTESVGYYSSDSDCDAQLPAFNYHCTGWYAGNQGTIYEDLRHISCELAWYIWDAYSSHGVHVQVVAHSMGGILIRQAIFDTPFETAFPPYLYIDNVVTAGTPHQGLGGGIITTQLAQLVATDALMANLNSTSFRNGFGRNPGAPTWGSTDWTTMISGVDEWIGAYPMESPETLGMPGINYPFSSWYTELDGLMPGAKHFVVYPCHDSSGYSYNPCYSHGGYLTDTNNNYGAYELFSDNNGGSWIITHYSYYSIYTMYNAVLSTNW